LEVYMYKRILLPLDGSAVAEQSLPHAVAQAARFDAELVLLRALTPLPRPATIPEATIQKTEAATARTAGDYLERVAAETSAEGIRTTVVLVHGTPHEQILGYAEENRIDLIVICTRGQSGFLSRWLMGSVSDRVVRGARVPVLVVRAAESVTEPA
jgi:nucleotide-binding universal stress UspA family protein